MAGAQPYCIQEMQASGLREWHRYLIGREASGCKTSLEVGCGSGQVMKNIGDLIAVRGLDIDQTHTRWVLPPGYKSVRSRDI